MSLVCRNGHVRDTSNTDARGRCRICDRVSNRRNAAKYRAAHPEEYKARHRAHFQTAKAKAARALWKEQNRAHERERERAWRSHLPDGYMRQLLGWHAAIPGMIEAKRQELLIRRLLKETKYGNGR